MKLLRQPLPPSFSLFSCSPFPFTLSTLPSLHLSITPSIHYSITPLLHPLLHTTYRLLTIPSFHHSITPRPVIPAGRFAGRGLVPRWRDGHHSALFVRFPEPCIVIEIQKAHPAAFWRASSPPPHPAPLPVTLSTRSGDLTPNSHFVLDIEALLL